MFSNFIQPDIYHEEGVILRVFPDGNVYSVQTTKGRTINNAVPLGDSTVGRGGFRKTFLKGDKVLLYFGLGYPIIIGCIPRPQIVAQASPVTVSDGIEPPETGSTIHGSAVRMNSTTPAGATSGDQVITSPGGSMMASLRGGTVVVRSSRNTELLLSRLKNLGRLFTSNWEHFSDVHTDVLKNLSGRLYRYVGFAKTYAETKIEDYKLHFYFGDVAAAEAIKSNYQSSPNPPAATPLLYKEQVTASGVIKMHRSLNDAGEEEIWISNGTHFTRVTSTAESLTFAWNDETYVVIDGTQIKAHHTGGSEVYINGSVIQAQHSGGAQIVMDGSSITATKGGKLTLTDGMAKLENGGHSITVTSGGVNIS